MATALTESDTTILLGIARQAIIAMVTEGHFNEKTPDGDALKECCGCFVTITQDGQLRGCIGNFTTDRPLYREVAEMAVAAATKDPRFHPMEKEELGNFNLEISVLTPLQKITDNQEIQVGTHGIYLENGYQRGVLLPQVATEHHWDRETFLQQTCRKAGLSADAWQAAGTDIYIFRATILQE